MNEPKLKDLQKVVEKILGWSRDTEANFFTRELAKQDTYFIELDKLSRKKRIVYRQLFSGVTDYTPHLEDEQARDLLDAITQEVELSVLYKTGYECEVHLPKEFHKERLAKTVYGHINKKLVIGKGNFNEAVTFAAIWLVNNGFYD